MSKLIESIMSGLLAQGPTAYDLSEKDASMFETPSWRRRNLPGLVTPGTLDITARPFVRNSDGTTSTMRAGTFGFEVNGKEMTFLLPTLSPNGARWTEEEARQNFIDTGEHFGMFDSLETATAYDDVFHEDLEEGLILHRRVLQSLTREGEFTPEWPGQRIPSGARRRRIGEFGQR